MEIRFPRHLPHHLALLLTIRFPRHPLHHPDQLLTIRFLRRWPHHPARLLAVVRRSPPRTAVPTSNASAFAARSDSPLFMMARP